ncbi:MAG: ROK family protein [Chloroflexi bacterium]|nr:ROK family protein [Chloroflexota bacterium]
MARNTKLSRATVSAIVEELIDARLVREARVGASRGGRRPTILELNPDVGRVVGIDIGATHLIVVVADLRGRALAECELGFDIASGPEAGLDRVGRAVDEMLRQAGCLWESVVTVAVGVPGPVVSKLGMVVAPPIMPGWDGFPIQKYLRERWAKPVYVDNDADLGALGEWSYGAGKNESNLTYIKIGTGIGCGILLDGQIYRGVLGTAGEIGHVTISEDGPPCTCGNYGCLEAMAGGRAIAQRAQLAIKAGQRTALTAISAARELTARDVAEAAKEGDAVAQQLLSDAGRHIGSALASLINLLNPGLVLLGGGVVGAGDILLNSVRAAVAERSMRPSLQATRVDVGSLGRRSTVMGAVSLGLTHTFHSYVEAG